jgi:hypothetical protein
MSTDRGWMYFSCKLGFYLYLFRLTFMGWHFCCLHPFYLHISYYICLFFPLLSGFFRFSSFFLGIFFISLYLCCTYLGRADMIPGGFIFFSLVWMESGTGSLADFFLLLERGSGRRKLGGEHDVK